MTIQEAIKSNRRFRRPTMSKNRWYLVKDGVMHWHQEPLGDMQESTGISNFFTAEDLLANDYEVEETYYQVSASKLNKALQTATEAADYDLVPKCSADLFRKTFFEELVK